MATYWFCYTLISLSLVYLFDQWEFGIGIRIENQECVCQVSEMVLESNKLGINAQLDLDINIISLQELVFTVDENVSTFF